MKIKLRINHEWKEFEANRIEIILENEKEFSIVRNNIDNSLIINKHGINQEAIFIKPKVSNEIDVI